MPTTTTTYVKLTEEAFQLLMVKIQRLSDRICALERKENEPVIVIDDAYVTEATAEWCTECQPVTPQAPGPMAYSYEDDTEE